MNLAASLPPSKRAIRRRAAVAAVLFGTILIPVAHAQTQDDSANSTSKLISTGEIRS